MCRKPNVGVAALITALSVIVVKSVSPQQEPQYLALITDIRGEVMVKKAKRAKFEKALWGMQLYQGDRLKTLEASEVSLLFSNNNLVTLGPNSTLTISEGPLSLKKSPKPIRNMDAELVADLSILTLRRTSEGEIGALAGLRFGGTEQVIVLLSPSNTKIRTTRPSFVWNSKREFDKYKVTLYDSDGPVWIREIPKSQLDYPEDENPLEYGGSYFWHVAGMGLFDSFKSHSVGFSILSREELEKVQLQEKSVKDMFKEDPNSSSFHFILGAYYERKSLLGDAITEFEIISKMNSSAPLPHEILGKLYSDIGLKDRAIAELQKAVELSQERE